MCSHSGTLVSPFFFSMLVSFGQKQPLPCALPCHARHDKRNATRPEQCVSMLFWGLHLINGKILKLSCRRVWYCSLHYALRRHLRYSLSTSIIHTDTSRNTTNEWMLFWACVAVDCVYVASTLVFVRPACAQPVLEAMCYDSGIYMLQHVMGLAAPRSLCQRGNTRGRTRTSGKTWCLAALASMRSADCSSAPFIAASQPSSPSLVFFSTSFLPPGHRVLLGWCCSSPVPWPIY